MQLSCGRQLAQSRVRAAQPAAVLSRPCIRTISSGRVFQPAYIGAQRSLLRSSVVVQAADVQAAPIDVSSLADNSNQTREGVAKLSFQRGSVFKVRRILDVLRGRTYEEALAICEYMPYRACELVTKVLMSAAANAKHNAGAMKAKLVVSEAYANQGPWLKRFRPRAQGRAFKRLKGTYHLIIRLSEQE